MINKKYYIQVSNKWFNCAGGENLSTIYGERGFVLMVRMMQQITRRGEYAITDYHLKEWFSYTDYRSLRSAFALLEQFRQDRLFVFGENYDFKNVYRGIIRYFSTDITSPASEYFKLYDDEVDGILLADVGTLDKYKLFLLFACLKYHYHTVTKLCYPSIEVLSEETRLSPNTILSYVDVLVDLGLILYENPGTKLYPSGDVKECNNIYTINYKGNKEILEKEIFRMEQELKEQEKNKQLKVINNVIGNQKRSVKTKMRHLDNRLNVGKITQQEYQLQRDDLQAQYDQLLDKQKSIHNQ